MMGIFKNKEINNIVKDSVKKSDRCKWSGCEKKGIISPGTRGGDFYCREHATEVMGIDFVSGSPEA